jgi:uncharacterized peroxidase-related enzyme
MSYISMVEPEEASPALRDAYARVGAARGRVANVLRAHSVNPAAMATHVTLYEALMFGLSELSRVEREVIAVAVSAANECAYCVSHHSVALRSAGGDPVLAAVVCGDTDAAPLDERGRALVPSATRLTRAPASMMPDDVAALRAVGLSDAAIHDATAVAAYFNFVNRLVHGLGVELEPGGGW